MQIMDAKLEIMQAWSNIWIVTDLNRPQIPFSTRERIMINPAATIKIHTHCGFCIIVDGMFSSSIIKMADAKAIEIMIFFNIEQDAFSSRK